MAENKDKLSKEEAKAAKEAAKAAEKERKERIKRNKPKKDENAPNIFARMWNAIKRFFKDFKGTCKKIVWPDAKNVLKSSGVVIACVLIVGVGIWVVDWGLSETIKLSTQAIQDIGINNEDKDSIAEKTTASAEQNKIPVATHDNGETQQGEN